MRDAHRFASFGRWLLAAALVLVLAPPAARAARGGNGVGNGGKGAGSSNHQGRLVLLLPDGTLREPSTDRAQATEDADVLDAGEWSWECSLAEASVASVAGSRTGGFDVLRPELRRGLGGGLELGVVADGWSGSRVEQGAPPVPVQESGLGGAALSLKQRLFAGEGGAGAALAASVQAPGTADSPGTHATEASLALPLAVPMGPRARFGAMLAGEWMADALDSDRHLNGVASVKVVRAIAGSRSSWSELASVWSREHGRPWLGVLDAGVEGDVAQHVGLRAGLSTGVGGGRGDVGLVGGVSVHD